MPGERGLSSLYQLILFLFVMWGLFLVLTAQRNSIFPLGVMIYNGREMYVVMGFVLFLLLYFVAPRLMFQGKKIFSDEAKPSLASYLLVLLIFSSGLWLRSIALFFFLPIFYLLTLIRGIGISKIEYPNRLKQHYSVMRLCLIIFLPSTIPFVVLGLSRGPEYISCLPEYPCLTHDLLALTLIILYFIVSSLEIKRKRDPWPFP